MPFDGVNLADIEESSFDALPVGRYHVKVTDWDETATKNAGKLPVGTPGANVEFTVQDGPYENRKLWTNFWIHPNTLGIFKTFAKAAGTDEGTLNDSSADVAAILDDLISADVVVKVRQRPYQGDMRNDINGYQPYDEDNWTPMEKTGSSSGGGGLLP
jgi:hypothetical protein